MNSNLTVAVKQEAQQNTNAYAESFVSQEDLDNESLFNASTASYSSYQNLVHVVYAEPKPNIDEKVQKEEEKPVVHRNTGKITRRRFGSSLAANPNRHHSNAAPYIRNTASTTQTLLIQPVLQHGQNNILVSTETSSTGKNHVFLTSFLQFGHQILTDWSSLVPFGRNQCVLEELIQFLSVLDVVELSDDDDEADDTNNNYQAAQLVQLQPQQQQPPPHFLAAVYNTIQQNMAAIQNQQTVTTIHNANRVHCAACNQSYVRTGISKHMKTKKHQDNEEALKRQNQNTNGTD